MDYENRGTDLTWKKNLLFAGIFIQENLLHTVFDRYNEMSSKQWLLMSVCKGFDSPPDLSTLAKAMGCSRQNVKKLAKNLEKAGYIELEQSKKDARSLCVILTEKGRKLNEKNTELGKHVHEAVFKEFTEEEIEKYFELFIKMLHGIEHLENYFKAEKEIKR